MSYQDVLQFTLSTVASKELICCSCLHNTKNNVPSKRRADLIFSHLPSVRIHQHRLVQLSSLRSLFRVTEQTGLMERSRAVRRPEEGRWRMNEWMNALTFALSLGLRRLRTGQLRLMQFFSPVRVRKQYRAEIRAFFLHDVHISHIKHSTVHNSSAKRLNVQCKKSKNNNPDLCEYIQPWRKIYKKKQNIKTIL